ncbi:hypothetical protein BKA82DRAFT_129128 [Pisolithus tinctorius]|uniref:Uncharacterized protein n=1 Tax=Pisolithus tinctorius Marx 270 TaxID=870435 RepID=A0A0C3KMV3_PISTI|nr:hypothetical protein BKA82DRAFT_129128 [Pisolithus tinctorius]KIO10912.1 hypothetical protein M404DRAFT_129128 [Pisolithus tinctorius Marx 270]
MSVGSDLSWRWLIGPISSPSLTWGAVCNGRCHQCQCCGIDLLTGEEPGFCCGVNGSHYLDVAPLPPLPLEIEAISCHPEISSLSHILNLVFSFASMETTHPFPDDFAVPGFLAIQGQVYHHIQPGHTNSAVCWLLYDGFMRNTPHAQWASKLPPRWIDAVRQALERVNPFVTALRSLSAFSISHPSATLILKDDGAAEITAVMSYENTSSAESKSR